MRREIAAWGILGTLFFLFSLVYLWQRGPSAMPGCLFHRLTGMECAGCGMTRATYALLHGRLDEAFRFNPVGIVLLPFAVVVAGTLFFSSVYRKSWPVLSRIGVVGFWFLVAGVIAFGILRNIPDWPTMLQTAP